MLLECIAVEFYSIEDESSFFRWLKSLACVVDVYGKGLSIMIDVKEPVSDDSLRELLAIFYRYKIDMTQLSIFKSKTNEDWFYCNTQAYWHRKIFQK